MIRSMTGFGAGRGVEGAEEISLEIRSVNHKFCEVKARLPRELGALETELVRLIKDRLHRGAIDLFVRRTAAGGATMMPRIDLALAQEYATLYQQVAKELELEGKPSINDILQAQGVLTLEERSADTEQAGTAARLALNLALDEAVSMREREGKALAEDLLARASLIREQASRIQEISPKSAEAYRRRLEARLAELGREAAVAPERLAQEVVMFADRIDVVEELTRLSSHLDQLEKFLARSPIPTR